MIRGPKGILLAPVPITADRYKDQIAWGNLGDIRAASAKAEMCRLLDLMILFKAYLQPIGFTDKEAVVWEIRYADPKSPWRKGPAMPSSYDALLANYQRNKCFPGRSPLDRVNQNEIMNLEKHVEASIDEADKKAEEIWKG